MLKLFKKRSTPIDPLQHLINEFWRVNKEIENARRDYDSTINDYVDCTVYDLNAKTSYRDVLLKEIRAHKDVDWSRIIKIRGVETAA